MALTSDLFGPFVFILVVVTRSGLVEGFLEVLGGATKRWLSITALHKTSTVREPYSLGLRPFLVKPKPNVTNLTQDILSHGGGSWIQVVNHHDHDHHQREIDSDNSSSVTSLIAVVENGDVSLNDGNHDVFRIPIFNGSIQFDWKNISLESPNLNFLNSSFLNATTTAPSTSEYLPSSSSFGTINTTTNSTAEKISASSSPAKSKTVEYNPPWAAYLPTLNLYQSSFAKKPDTNTNRSSVAAAPATILVLSNPFDSLSTSLSSTTSSSSSSPLSSVFDFSSKKRSDLLTLHDLESILLTNKFVRESDLKKFAEAQQQTKASSSATLKAMDSATTASKRIAFPQPSTLNAKTLQWGCIVSSSICSMILATSLVPNLWLMGLIAGGLYGSEVGKRHQKQQELAQAEEWLDASPTSIGPLASLVVNMGRRLALAYLRVFDTCNTVFFMYKTGQLSYEYYKTYASLDQRFAIQKKIDAWNAVFVEGKIAFDKWEKENEVGRKILAGLRTAWFIEEQSLKKSRLTKRLSKYRIIQFVYDIEYFMQTLVRSLWKAVTGGGSSEFRDFLKGLRIELSESRAQQIGSRIGSVLAALVAVNLMGAMFAMSPSLLSALAILVGVVWPTWSYEFYERAVRFVEETRARGRGEQPAKKKVDKRMYHYYVRENGKKRYYRTGRPWFDNNVTPDDKRKQKNRKKQSDGIWDWGIFRRD